MGSRVSPKRPWWICSRNQASHKQRSKGRRASLEKDPNSRTIELMVDDERDYLHQGMMDDEDLFLTCELDDMFDGDGDDGQLSHHGLYDGFLHDSPLRDTPQGNETYQTLRALALTAFVSDGRLRQPWHNPEVDKPERQRMVIDISRLLHTRKKGEVSQKWLQQLPHKARKLEMRLYHEASSLEVYKDRETLKPRLLKLARKITDYFLQTNGPGQQEQVQTCSVEPSPSPSLPIPNTHPQVSVEALPKPTRRKSLPNRRNDTEQSSLRNMLLAHTPTDQPEMPFSSADPKTNYAHSGMLQSVNHSGHSLSEMLANAPMEVQSPAALAPMHLPTQRQQPVTSQHPAATSPYDYVPDLHATGLSDGFYSHDSPLPLYLPGASAQGSTQTDMQELLTSRLLAQQQQILNNIQQQEALIRHLQSSRQQQQQLGQGSGYLTGQLPLASGDPIGFNAAAQQQQHLYLPAHQQQQPKMPFYEYQQQQQQPEVTGMDPRLVMSGRMLQYQQGIPSPLQLERQQDVAAAAMSMSNQNLLALSGAGQSQVPLGMTSHHSSAMHLQHPELVQSHHHDNMMPYAMPQQQMPGGAAALSSQLPPQRPSDGSLEELDAAIMAHQTKLAAADKSSTKTKKDSSAAAANARKKPRKSQSPSRDSFEW